jgi:hypothetical protein
VDVISYPDTISAIKAEGFWRPVASFLIETNSFDMGFHLDEANSFADEILCHQWQVSSLLKLPCEYNGAVFPFLAALQYNPPTFFNVATKQNTHICILLVKNRHTTLKLHTFLLPLLECITREPYKKNFIKKT